VGSQEAGSEAAGVFETTDFYLACYLPLRRLPARGTAYDRCFGSRTAPIARWSRWPSSTTREAFAPGVFGGHQGPRSIDPQPV